MAKESMQNKATDLFSDWAEIGKDEGKSMQAGAAMAVVGWWTGYKLGGVISLNAAEYFEKSGFDNYCLWNIPIGICKC